MNRRTVLAIGLLLPLAASAAGAQVIPTRTIPIAQGDQFRFLPSANAGMGDASIALSDTLLDPFVNPATAARLDHSGMFGSPTFFSMSHDAGGGSTLPAGAWLRSADGATFGALAAAVQVIDSARQQPFFPPPVPLADKGAGLPGIDLTETPQQVSRTNRYVFASLGHALRAQHLSFAASALWSGLHDVDGVETLFAGSQSVRQDGNALDLRVGGLKEWAGGRSLDVLALHRQFNGTDAAQYLDTYWDPATRSFSTVLRTDRQRDVSSVWGLNARYQRPLSADSIWRVGALFTANRATHPERPDYGAMSAARDPATATAFDFGLGVSRREGIGTFALDAIYEPMWSRDSIEGAPSDMRFRFSNMVMRTGVSADFPVTRARDAMLRLEAGLQVRAVHYQLSQVDTLGVFERVPGGWNEWTRSAGANLRLTGLELHYVYRMTSGLSRVQTNQFIFIEGPPGGGGGFGGGPFGPGQINAQLTPVRVVIQQVYVSMPLP